MADKTIEDLLAEKLAEPKSVTVDGVTMTQHSVSDLIAMDKHLCGKASAKRGLRLTKIVPPGAP